MKDIKINVTGMVCEGCEKRVVNALNLIDGVSSVVANHNDNTVTFKMNEDVSLDEVKEAITDLGFEVE